VVSALAYRKLEAMSKSSGATSSLADEKAKNIQLLGICTSSILNYCSFGFSRYIYLLIYIMFSFSNQIYITSNDDFFWLTLPYFHNFDR
jgi:hypothetical protein